MPLPEKPNFLWCLCHNDRIIIARMLNLPTPLIFTSDKELPKQISHFKRVDLFNSSDAVIDAYILAKFNKTPTEEVRSHVVKHLVSQFPILFRYSHCNPGKS